MNLDFKLIKPSISSVQPALASCGNTGNRIAGGIEAKKNSWPWIVNLRFEDGKSAYGSFCGGTIIEKNWVLTAAHCCKDKLKVFMNFGQHNVTGADSGEFTLGWFSDIFIVSN